MTTHRVTLRFDREFLAAALARDYRRRAVVSVTVFALGIALVLFLLYGPEVFTTISGVVYLAAVVAVILANVWRLRRAVDRAHEIWTLQSPSGIVHYDVDDEGLHIHMDKAEVRYPWTDIHRLREYPEVWLLELGPRANLYFPVEVASAAARELVRERCGGSRPTRPE